MTVLNGSCVVRQSNGDIFFLDTWTHFEHRPIFVVETRLKTNLIIRLFRCIYIMVSSSVTGSLVLVLST